VTILVQLVKHAFWSAKLNLQSWVERLPATGKNGCR